MVEIDLQFIAFYQCDMAVTEFGVENAVAHRDIAAPLRSKADGARLCLDDPGSGCAVEAAAARPLPTRPAPRAATCMGEGVRLIGNLPAPSRRAAPPAGFTTDMPHGK